MKSAALVSATGLTRDIAFGMLLENEKAIFLPVFLYPNLRIEDKNGRHKNRRGMALRVFDWLPTDKYDVKWSDEGKPLNARLWRKGNSADVTAVPKGKIVYACEQGPREAYAIWQRDGILDIGHFSYRNHHWFVWANLRRYIVERSTDSHDMTSKMVNTLERWKPAWVFYVSHETTDALMDRLWREAQYEGKAFLTENNSWSLGDISGFSALLTPDAIAAIMGNKVAVIIDDATVSGKTMQNGKHKLRQLGFKYIHSMVILDRQDPNVSLNSTQDINEEHFAWWSLYIPEIGSLRSCRICQGVRALQKISDGLISGSIKNTIQAWIDNWHRTDSLQRFQNAIPGIVYDDALEKRLGETEFRNIKIHTSEAACAWSLEIAHRLEWYSFMAEEDNHRLGDAITECIAGVLLHYWENLHDTHKRALAWKFIDRLWTDNRENARSLVAVCLASLRDKEFETVLLLLSKKIHEKGIANIDAMVFIYVVLCVVKRNMKARIDWVKSLHGFLENNRSSIAVETYRKTISFIQAIETTLLSDISGWDVLLSLGLPGRSSDHENIFSVIYRLRTTEKTAAAQIQDLSLLKIFLEPIERCVRDHRTIFEDIRLIDPLNNAIGNFNNFCSDKTSLFDRDCLLTVIDDLNTVLNVGGRDYPSARRAINAEFLHYLPFVVREQINELIDKKLEIGLHNFVKEDFLLDGPALLSEEDQLLNRSDISPQKRAELLAPLHEKTVAISSRLPLASAVRDCLV